MSPNLIRSDKPEGTKLTVRSKRTGEKTPSYVDTDGVVRSQDHGKSFSRGAYEVVGDE